MKYRLTVDVLPYAPAPENFLRIWEEVLAPHKDEIFAGAGDAWDLADELNEKAKARAAAEFPEFNDANARYFETTKDGHVSKTYWGEPEIKPKKITE